MSVSSHHAIPERQANGDSNESTDDLREPVINRGSVGIPYFTPMQSPPAGTATDTEKAIPKLFQPLTVRGVTFQNRIFLSPLCQYSADYGHHTMWHQTWLGSVAMRGPGLTMVEATSVTPNGRITPEDSGIWQDSQIEPLRKTVEFAHSQGQKIAIQIGHAGRKASTVAPWLRSGSVATKEVGGWPDDVYGPSAIKWNEDHADTKAMTLSDIQQFKISWVQGIKRALTAGFDAIEIHNAHGYLLHSFLSPVANQRKDRYGGSFENRTRLTRELVELTRQTIPDSMPLFLRISATDWLDEVAKTNPDAPQESWTIEDTVKLAPILAELGVDVLDVSSGGMHPLQHPHAGPAYQAPFSKKVKEVVGDKMIVTAVGNITTGPQANQLIEEGLDAVFCGRTFQKDPSLVWTFADQLKLGINDVQQAGQLRWGFGGRGVKAPKKSA